MSEYITQTLERWLNIPTPKQLGWSESNSLGMRGFNNGNPENDNQKSWEDYHEYCAKHYPIRWFIADTIPHSVLYPIKRFFSNVKWWIIGHTTQRHHLLDLRQPKLRNGQKNFDHYSWGYSDVVQKMVLANFTLLVEFVEKEDKYCPTEKEIAETSEDNGKQILIEQRNNCLEVQAIYNYWTKDRNVLAEKQDALLTAWCDTKDSDTRKQHWSALNKLEQANNDLEDEMLVRLMKVRRSLWT